MPERTWYRASYTCLFAFAALILGSVVWILIEGPSSVFPRAVDLVSPNHSKPQDAAFELAKIYTQALLALCATSLLAAGAYIIVTYAKARNEALQTSLARFRLVTELNQEIRTIYNSLSVYGTEVPAMAEGDPSVPSPSSSGAFGVVDVINKLAEAIRNPPAGEARVKAIPFISVMDRNTTWLKKGDGKWRYGYGERTARFVEESQVDGVGPMAEIGLIALHDYVHWFRRLRLGVDVGILEMSDVEMYWRYLVGFASGRRYTFMCHMFNSDMKDYAYLINKLILWEDDQGRHTVLDYVCNVRGDVCTAPPDCKLLADLTDGGRKKVEEYWEEVNRRQAKR